MSLLHGTGANSSPEGGKLSFKDYFTSGISLPKLIDGCYDAVLQNYSFVEPASKDAKPYVRLELRLTNPEQKNRIIVDNRFEIGFSKFETEIKDQLGLSDQSMPIPALMELVVKTPFKIWVTHTTIEGRTYRNINYMPPIVPPKSETAETAEDKLDI